MKNYEREFNKKFNYFIAFLIAVFLVSLNSCSTPKQTIQYIPDVRTEYIEKLRDTTIYVEMPVERIVNVTLDTASSVETTIAKSDVVVKDGALIVHSIENKDITLPTKIVYKDIVRHDTTTVVKTVYEDKIVEKTKYPSTYWWFMGISILAVLYIGLKIYLKIKL